MKEVPTWHHEIEEYLAQAMPAYLATYHNDGHPQFDDRNFGLVRLFIDNRIELLTKVRGAFSGR